MAAKLDFHFPLSVLLDQGDKIVAAAETNTGVNGRLPANYVTESRTLIGDVTSGDATQKGDVGEIGTLTLAQQDALKVLQPLIAGAKDTAKRAFKGNDTKLHSEFQVGVNKPTELGAVLERARIVSASLKVAGNLTALTAKGWLPADTVKIDAAITTLTGADGTQETAKSDKLGDTSTRNRDANDLYERLLTIQNAASLQWPADDPDHDNTSIRDQFRLGKFPPHGGSAPPTTPPPTTPPPA